MTAYAVLEAFYAHREELSRLAYRTAIYHRMSAKHLPKNEEAIFAKAKKAAKRQSFADQFAMARFVTQAMTKH